MSEILATHAPCGKTATRKRNRALGIILGCQRINGTWADVLTMARNGYAVTRDGRDARLFWSGAYETECLQ